MAYARRTRRTASRRSSYRSYRPTRRTGVRRRTTGARAPARRSSQTVRIVVQAAAQPPANAAPLGFVPAAAPRKARV